MDEFDKVLDALIKLIELRKERDQKIEENKGKSHFSSRMRPVEVKYEKAKKDFINLVGINNESK